jgi:plasmid maintenance system antidote protein VapI
MLTNKPWKNEINKVVGLNLRSIMQRFHMKQSRLAFILGVDKGFVHARLSGKTPMTVHDIVAIQKVLGLSKAETQKYYQALFNNTTKIEVFNRHES